MALKYRSGCYQVALAITQKKVFFEYLSEYSSLSADTSDSARATSLTQLWVTKVERSGELHFWNREPNWCKLWQALIAAFRNLKCTGDSRRFWSQSR